MLGGVDPVIIFQFSKILDDASATIARIPVISQIPTVVDQPPIPIYLSEQLFKIALGAESKSVDISTETETLTDGTAPDVNQKGIQSSVEINIQAKRDSVPLILLCSMIDLVYDKVSSKEYSISYLHGPTTIFRGVLHSFSVETIDGTDLCSVKISLSKGTKQPTKPETTPVVPAQVGALPGG